MLWISYLRNQSNRIFPIPQPSFPTKNRNRGIFGIPWMGYPNNSIWRQNRNAQENQKGEAKKKVRFSKDNWKTLKAVLIVIACLYVMSGGFYNRLIKPGQFAYWQGNWYNISPKMDEQTTSESLLVFVCYATTFLGILLMASSGTSKKSRLTANRLMLLGLSLFLAGWIGSYLLLEMKRLPWYN